MHLYNALLRRLKVYFRNRTWLHQVWELGNSLLRWVIQVAVH